MTSPAARAEFLIRPSEDASCAERATVRAAPASAPMLWTSTIGASWANVGALVALVGESAASEKAAKKVTKRLAGGVRVRVTFAAVHDQLTTLLKPSPRTTRTSRCSGMLN